MAQKMSDRLTTESAYEQALDEIERYFDNEPKPGTPEAARFDELSRLIDDYENEHWPIAKAGRRKTASRKAS
jgi:HTH-type transcriptional regulator/antitoxin HigA